MSSPFPRCGTRLAAQSSSRPRRQGTPSSSMGWRGRLAHGAEFSYFDHAPTTRTRLPRRGSFAPNAQSRGLGTTQPVASACAVRLRLPRENRIPGAPTPTPNLRLPRRIDAGLHDWLGQKLKRPIFYMGKRLRGSLSWRRSEDLREVPDAPRPLQGSPREALARLW